MPKHHHYGARKIPRNLTNPPFDPPVFIGRDEALQTVHDRLCAGDNFLMLVNGQGGIGKTSFAAKYWKNYQHKYQHRAFLFVGNGIENALLGIARELGVAFPDTMPGRERLTILLQHISELDRPCLIILDNANDADDLDDHYRLLRTCSNCHLLITSRLTAFRESPTHPIGALSEALALQLFQQHYPQHHDGDDALFFGIFRAVGGNTLVVEILAKNLQEINSIEVFYPLEVLLADLQQQGLLRLSEQAAIRVDWQNLEKSTPEQIISAMYDLRPLTPDAIALLSAFAVLLAENIAYELLKTLLVPDDARAFSQQLSALHQKGWIEKNDIADKPHFKCSPVVQEVVRGKNQELLAHCEGLIDQLIEKLDYETGSGHLINATYKEAAVFARYAETLVLGISIPNYNLGMLCERIARYYTTTGNLDQAYFFQEKYVAISQTLLATDPDNPNFKKGLAISYSKLGETHSALGNLSKALTFFEYFNQLMKALHESYPGNMDFKKGLAISYSKLGETHSSLGNLPKVLTFFEHYNQLMKALHESYPENVSFKNGLAISYSKLGETHTVLGNLPKALIYNEKANETINALHESYPENVSFKNGLAISYLKLGETHTALGNLPQALTFFEEMSMLFKALHKSYPENVSFKNGLAVSYSKLGRFYRDQKNDKQQAKAYFQWCHQLWQELSETHPDYQDFKINYNWAKNALSNLDK